MEDNLHVTTKKKNKAISVVSRTSERDGTRGVCEENEEQYQGSDRPRVYYKRISHGALMVWRGDACRSRMRGVQFGVACFIHFL